MPSRGSGSLHPAYDADDDNTELPVPLGSQGMPHQVPSPVAILKLLLKGASKWHSCLQQAERQLLRSEVSLLSRTSSTFFTWEKSKEKADVWGEGCRVLGNICSKGVYEILL